MSPVRGSPEGDWWFALGQLKPVFRAFVIAGLDPAIHGKARILTSPTGFGEDTRLKPGHGS